MLTFSSLLSKIFAVLAGTMILSASSYIAIPMVPVPVTLQTFAVTLIGALYGWRVGAAAIVLWLGAGALGLPVLADGSGGIEKFMGPTAGYLFAFPLAGALTGWLVERQWDGSRLVFAFLAMLAGSALCLVFGAAWLSFTIGVQKALVHGVLPFLPGAVLKSIAAAVVLKVVAGSSRLVKPATD